jgi:dipeptidyl aminopeptidase/acylaminoacyl peptidase
MIRLDQSQSCPSTVAKEDEMAPLGRKSWPVRSLVLAAALVMGAAQPSTARAEEPALVAHLAKQHRISGAAFSPDGLRAVFVVAEPAAGKDRRSDIWLYDSRTQATRKLTAAGKRDSQPRWSPDGQTIAFISARGDEKPQVYLLPMNGGEAQPLTAAEAGVNAFEWSPTGGGIAYVAQDPSPESAAKAAGDDEIVASEGFGPQRLSVIDLHSKTARKVLSGDRWAIGMFAWTPGGERLVATASDGFRPEGVINRLFEISAAEGAMREIGTLEGVEFSDLRVSPDGRLAAFIGSGDGPMPHDLYVQPLAGGAARNLTGAGSPAGVDRPVIDPAWTGPSALTFATEEGFGGAVYSLSTASGRARELRRFRDQSVSSFAVSGDRMIYAKASSVAPVEVWASMGGTERQVTNLHPGFTALVEPQLIKYPGADGFEIEAQVFTPPGATGASPLVVLVHGGPTGRWSHSLNNWAQLLVREGIVVLAPNIRGSVGYGYAFVKSNRADWGGGDFRDVMAGVDHMIAQGIADPARLGIAGWSYGGYMSAWAVTQTQRFKAAVVGAAMLDLETQWGTEEASIIPYDSWYVGTPWNNRADFARMSPITHVKNVTTPTLLLVGEDDPVDPIAQSRQFFRALRMNGVEAELVVYPREGHRINEELHARDVLTRTTRWLADHVKAGGG